MICYKIKKCVDMQFAIDNQKHTKLQCPNPTSNCIASSDTRSKVKCEERGKRYILDNTRKKHDVSFNLDGGVIQVDKTVPQNTSKCDNMLVIENSKVILIELKGVDVAHSIKQLQETLKLFGDFLKAFDSVYGRVVIRSMSPRIKASPDYVKLRTMFKERYNGNLKLSEICMEEKDTQL